jgi:hypothetical protein
VHPKVPPPHVKQPKVPPRWINNVPAGTKQKLQNMTTKAQQKQQQARKSAAQAQAKPKPSKLRTIQKQIAFGLAGTDFQNLQGVLGGSKEGKGILQKLKDGVPLSDEEIGFLKASGIGKTPAIRGSIAAALAANATNQNLASIMGQLANLGGGSTVVPGDPGYPPQDWLPGCPVAVFPNDPGQVAGPGIVAGIVPGSLDIPSGEELGGLVSDLGEANTDLTTALDSVSPLQTTRYLRLANTTNEQVTISLQYYTPTKDGEAVWCPGNPEDSATAISYELEPGESADIEDNGWRINATRARIWAKSKTREWLQFKDKDFWLVPEAREGEGGYWAPEIGVASFVVR